MEKLSQICGGFLLCSLLASFAYQSKRLSDNMQARFITSAYMCGLFFYCHEIIFFDPKYKIFGVMANVLISVGAVTGGVVGVLLSPKLHGIVLGLYVSVLANVCVALSVAGSNLDQMRYVFPICIASIILSAYCGYRYERICIDVSTVLSFGLLVALTVDSAMSSALLPILSSILRLDNNNYASLCFSKSCHVTELTVLWIVTASLGFLPLAYQSGLLSALLSWRSGTRGHTYSSLSTTAEGGSKSVAEKQRTYTYPDTLEFNYLDPDNIPELLEPYAESIFTIVQMLSKLYGFQVDNARNQAEHLLMILFNETAPSDKLITGPAYRIHVKIFANYRLWCDRMGVGSLLMRDMSLTKYEVLVEDILMFLLVWGESANLRHMPECLCCLFHKTMQEHVTIKSLRGTSNGRNGQQSQDQSQNRYPGYFLDMVVTPIYDVVTEALKKSGDHIEKKTYDDFNEFFWSPMCIKYRIHDQVSTLAPRSNSNASFHEFIEQGITSFFPNAGGFYNGGDGVHVDLAAALKAANKTYLEKRSWLHPLYSMHRVFEWHVITFTLLAVWSFHNALQWTYAFTFQVGTFIFWEITFFSVLWTILEVWTVFPEASLSDPSKYGFLIRLVVGYLVLAYQTVYFHWSFVSNRSDSSLNSLPMFKQGDYEFWWWQYVWLSLLTSSVYLIECFLCWAPSIVSNLLSWKNEVLEALLNICYPFSQLYVGKNVHVPQKEVFGYIAFWLSLIAFKLWFGYHYVVFPVTVPTLELYDDYMNFESVSFFKTSSLIFFWWFPHFLVYIIDLSIWYAVWSSIVGGAIAIIDRQGAVRESKAFRIHFMRAPLVIVQKLMPSSSMLSQKAQIILKASTASLTSILMVSNPTPKSSAAAAVAAPPKDIKARNDAIKSKKTAITSLGGKSNRAKSSADLQMLADFDNEKEESTPPRKKVSAPVEQPDLADNVAGFLDVRSQRWVIFARIWNEIINKLRETDEISNVERQNFLFTYFDWLSKPTYLPLYQTAGSVGLAAIAFKDTSSQYFTEKDSQKKMIILEVFSKSMTATLQEAVHEAWELTAWMLGALLGENHMKDFDRIILVLFNWAVSNDIFARVYAENVSKIIASVTNIVKALNGCLAKRASNPIAGPEILLRYNQEAVKMKESTLGHGQGGSGKGIKKSVSTGFLSALAGEMNDTGSSSNTSSNSNSLFSGALSSLTPDKDQGISKAYGDEKSAQKKSFTKLQPFRKGMELFDTVRDKVREEIRILLNALRVALKVKTGMTAEGQDLVDRITFILSLESGFIWSDVYASVRIDNFAMDARSKSALSKLHGLLNLRITQVELKSREAKRRLHFFMNSLFMDIPSVPSSRYAKEYTVMTPFYSEDVLLSKSDLESKNSDGVSTLLYLQTLYKDDWNNFLERRNISNDEQQVWHPTHLQELRCWASLRAQTLYRTVQGMMHSEAAVKLYAELEQLTHAEVETLCKLKFNYVVACQVYGHMKKTQDSKADDIEYLLAKYPNLRVAYIDTIRMNKSGDLLYFSVLVKHDAGTAPSFKKSIKEVFRVQLPGNPVLGEGKPENQNHAIIFTRGRYLQAIDMNQDGYFEESLKMRNLLEEFESGCVILGFREHIFTGSVSSVANYMALQELSFVTLGQRVLNQPLRIRQHYGHPDLFNKLFVMTQGGMSKASKGINLSEDVFSGFNATIRGQTVGFKEYVQVGKGRDVGLQQTYKFEAKLAQGNAEQSISRDLSRICDRLDFFRLMSFYYGGIGHYMANTMVMFTLVVVVYTMLALAVYDEEGVNGRPMHPEGVLQLLLSGMGLLQTLPLMVTLTVEKGFLTAMSEIGYMFLSGGPLYFIFHIETKCYYFSQTLLAGGAMYRPTGRGFVTRHSPFDENYRFFASSHIYLGFELTVALVLFAMYTKSTQYFGLTWSLWLTVVAFLMGPFWFNPLSFEWNKISEDYMMWIGWMSEIGGASEQSWDAWWKEENHFYHTLSTTWKVFLIVQKCFLWVFIARGLVGHRFLTDKGEQGRFMEVVGLFFFFFLGNWIINKLERYLSYAVRRFASLCLTTFVMVTTIYLVTLHTQYIRYTVAVYYFLSSISFLFLVMGYHNQINFVYKLHDYIVGHSIFLLLIICASLQLGYFQTWLLYYDALSAGVEMKDILKYARRSKERSTDETETINDLKLQVQKQEKLIREMMGKSSDASEKSSLLPNNYSSDYKGGSFGYGSVPAKEGSSILIINPLSTAAATSATSRVVHPADGVMSSPPRENFIASSPRNVDMRRGNGLVLGAMPTTSIPLSAGSRGPVLGSGPGLGASAFPSVAAAAAPSASSLVSGGDSKSGRPKMVKPNESRNTQSNPSEETAASSDSGKGPSISLPMQPSTTPPAAASSSGKEETKAGGAAAPFVFSQPTQFPSRN